jgi:hypothetical protein
MHCLGRLIMGFPSAPFTAMQHSLRIAPKALELGLRMVMIAARSCGATALAGISR